MKAREYTGPTYVIIDWSNFRAEWEERARFGKLLLVPLLVVCALYDGLFLFIFLIHALKMALRRAVYKDSSGGSLKK